MKKMVICDVFGGRYVFIPTPRLDHCHNYWTLELILGDFRRSLQAHSERGDGDQNF